MSYDTKNIENGFTIGLIGSETDYQGMVYLDNVTLMSETKQEEDIYVMNHPMAPPQPPYPPQPPRPPYPPRPVNWFHDLIQVLLQDEMYHRRCRNRNCRRW